MSAAGLLYGDRQQSVLDPDRALEIKAARALRDDGLLLRLAVDCLEDEFKEAWVTEFTKINGGEASLVVYGYDESDQLVYGQVDIARNRSALIITGNELSGKVEVTVSDASFLRERGLDKALIREHLDVVAAELS